ncbi:class I SAM-dependent methyltransferase [Streptomyces sp. MP131-18]|uniref:class I SAM-dependent methyltransferase n=1 Tax=Streptomyces sp. MP131-18 TaxID=1857892 RepID=UPI0009D45CFD|nr:class I SAM-dependent methyltransferase [Streptomyces sp. MP131-18]ONK13927.1 Malonyl-CoA O-methyltransferase BioC [Streptomyces sp. MP131-18]
MHAHQHDHAATDEIDWEAMGDHLEREADIQSPFLTAAVAWLAERLPGARRVVDVGSGPGVAACEFAGRLPHAEVVAVDGAPGLLARAAARAEAAGVADRLHTRHADLSESLAGLGPADLIWAGRFVHHLGDQQAALGALAAALRPGGLLALVEGGLPARFLPRDIGLGRPGLLTRLDAVEEERFAQMREELPGRTETVEDWPGMLVSAGLTGALSRTFLVDTPAPLGGAARAHLHGRLVRLLHGCGDRLDAEDRGALEVLTDPEAAESILRRQDAFYLTAVTVHTAQRPL